MLQKYFWNATSLPKVYQFLSSILPDTLHYSPWLQLFCFPLCFPVFMKLRAQHITDPASQATWGTWSPTQSRHTGSLSNSQLSNIWISSMLCKILKVLIRWDRFLSQASIPPFQSSECMCLCHSAATHDRIKYLLSPVQLSNIRLH